MQIRMMPLLPTALLALVAPVPGSASAQDSARTVSSAGGPLISRDSLARIVADRVRTGRSTGLIVGVVPPGGTPFFVASGNERGTRPVDAGTVVEIGSITKAFTGILLADMVARGEVRLDQPVSELLPASVTMPSRGGKVITLADLSSQVSGLPRLPGNMKPADPTNPYADYTVAQLYEFLSAHTLRREPGAQYEYSNLGVGLLGHVLALRAGKPYEELLRERVLLPLGMTNTGITLTSAMRARMSEGHDPGGQVVPLWDLPTLAGAGALRSSLEDMLKFAAAVASPPATAAGRAIAQSIAPRFTVNRQLSLGLNWHRVVMQGDTVIFHNGGTAGFRTFVGINARTRAAVVLLGTSAQDNEDVARHVLVGMPLIEMKPRVAITLPAESLQEYVGEYRLTPQFSLTVTREGNALHVQPTGQPKFPLFAEARDRFFLRVVDAQLEFERDQAGAVTAVTLVQNGARQLGTRVR